MGNKSLLLIILAVSIATHFAFFGHPNQIVFDEVHFGKFISGYYTHQYYFDIHPPLGKLIIAGFAKLFDFKPEFSFANIGESFPDNVYLALRFLPTLAGTLLPLVVFFLALELRFSRWGAFTAGMFVALENALVTQSRFILLDSFLLLFGFGALACYFRWRNSALKATSYKLQALWLVGAGILGGMAISIKWTGLSFLALPLIIEAVDGSTSLTTSVFRSRTLRAAPKIIASLILVPVILYYAVFALHFSLLTRSGPGDAFMSWEFQKTLSGSSASAREDIRPATMPEKFLELNVEMYRSNQRLTSGHPYSSSWYSWPLMIRSIFYWVDGNERIYLLGNPLLWWLTTVAIIVALLTLFYGTASRSMVLPVLLGGYLLNLLPFIGIKRVMFLYHYLTALVFGILILAFIIDRSRNARAIALSVIAAVAVLFIFFAPLSYGLSLTEPAYYYRVWLSSWR